MQDVIDANPNRWFTKAPEYGCTFSFTFSPGQQGMPLLIHASRCGEVVDKGEFLGDINFGGPPTQAHVQNVEVLDSHLRNGVGTSLYILAAGVWAQPGRPFGNRRAP